MRTEFAVQAQWSGRRSSSSRRLASLGFAWWGGGLVWGTVAVELVEAYVQKGLNDVCCLSVSLCWSEREGWRTFAFPAGFVDGEFGVWS
jgi:hypothetical protein